MEFAEFAGYAADAEGESADLATVSVVADLLSAAGEDVERVARFVQGRVFPAHDSTKLDVGPSLCYEAIARAAGTNVTADDVEDRLADVGEIGEVAESFDLGGQTGLGAFSGAREALTVSDVDDRLREAASASGAGSEDAKRQALFGLFSRAEPREARYLARLVLSEMRIGVGEGTVRDAVAEAFEVPVEEVERALQVSNDYGLVARVAREDGVDGLADVTLEVGRPVQAMLAQAGAVTDAVAEWDAVAVETKYDGARVQLHHDGDDVALFSRNMEDVTDALPELVEFAADHVDVPAIVDGEAVAVSESGDPLPFQEILTRFRRKHDVERAREEVRVELRAFDCLHVDGADLLAEPLRERHRRVVEMLPGEAVSAVEVTDDAGEVERLEEAALAAGHEGVMLKNPGSAYTPGRRGKNWLKRKPDVETLDCVVTGAEWGEGRRATFLGTFELSVRDGDDYETVGNVATGVTDEELADLTDLLEPHVLREDGQDVDLEPAVVFEVGYEEIQASPTYSSGYALRFPRFAGVREDLDPGDADSLERVERLAGGE